MLPKLCNQLAFVKTQKYFFKQAKINLTMGKYNKLQFYYYIIKEA